MQKSKIFKLSEQAEIDRQEKGDYSDKYGLFSRCIKPKIIAIIITIVSSINFNIYFINCSPYKNLYASRSSHISHSK